MKDEKYQKSKYLPSEVNMGILGAWGSIVCVYGKGEREIQKKDVLFDLKVIRYITDSQEIKKIWNNLSVYIN